MELHIPLAIWNQMQTYVKACLPCEVTGAGAIRTLDENNVIVEELFLPYQDVTPSYSEFAKYEDSRIMLEYDQLHPNETDKLCFRWHSHGHLKTFWSQTDEADIARWKGDRVFNLVTNAKGDLSARLDIFRPQRIANLPVQVVIDYPEPEASIWRRYVDEAHAKVRQHDINTFSERREDHG